MQFITFPPRKIGQKIEVQKGLPDPHKHCPACGKPETWACNCSRSDLVEPGEQATLGGRSWPALKENKVFDSSRVAELPLFAKVGRLF